MTNIGLTLPYQKAILSFIEQNYQDVYNEALRAKLTQKDQLIKWVRVRVKDYDIKRIESDYNSTCSIIKMILSTRQFHQSINQKWV